MSAHPVRRHKHRKLDFLHGKVTNLHWNMWQTALQARIVLTNACLLSSAQLWNLCFRITAVVYILTILIIYIVGKMLVKD